MRVFSFARVDHHMLSLQPLVTYYRKREESHMYQGPHSALAMIEVGQLQVALKLVRLYHGAMSDVLDTRRLVD
jgi:hypothetical protein